MEYTHILLLICVNVVSCYYFYNPASHQLLTLKSLNDLPKGYKLLPSPRNNNRRSRLTRGRSQATCPDAGFTCDSPYDKSRTQQFECTTDRQCPSNYRCCPQKCFLHNICVQVSSQIIDDNNCDKPRPGLCEKWPYNCQTPYSYRLTYMFKCNGDNHCPRNFKCCQQSCFAHRICSRIVRDVETPPIKLIEEKTTTRRTTTTTTTEPTPTEEIEEETEPTAAEEDYGEETVTTGNEEDYNEAEDDESYTTESIPETTEAEEEADTTTESTTETVPETNEEEDGEEVDNIAESTTETEVEILEVSIPEQTTIPEDTEVVELESTGGQMRGAILVKHIPNVTTPDSNAINPEYAPYYYHYDNNTETYDDYDEYDEGEDK